MKNNKKEDSNNSNNNSNSTADNISFSGPIKQGKFFYLDKFILLSCKNNLLLYKYYLAEDNLYKDNDLKR